MKLRYFVLFCMLFSFSIGADESEEGGCAALQESLGCTDDDDGDDGGGGGGGTPVPPYILFTDNECEIGAAYFPYVKGTINLTGRVWNNSYYEPLLWENVYFKINNSTTVAASSNDSLTPHYYAASLNTTPYAAGEGSISVIMHANSAVNGTEADSDSQTYIIDNTAIVVDYVTPSPGTVSGLVGIEFTLDDPVSWVALDFNDSASGDFSKMWSGVQSSGTFTHSFDSTGYAEGTATFLITGDDRFEVYFEEPLSVTIENSP